MCATNRALTTGKEWGSLALGSVLLLWDMDPQTLPGQMVSTSCQGDRGPDEFWLPGMFGVPDITCADTCLHSRLQRKTQGLADLPAILVVTSNA